ncbi:hypothetical protein BS47DRAFT_1371927 [Hydnum rufescens UP504]|uniref:Uracil catabolism protein 4 n=1 Tax=Hydnum rufescens UP504 TaxID=1448309 RepID=A0A9P6B1J4_9AGAM|nr:hypothetical protein BS47DRAFT_1371927 [Hydnum rufescens UP504]
MNLATDLSPAQRVAYLQTLPAIRERCGRVYELAKLGKLEHFDYHPEKESDVVDFCIEIIQRDFDTNYTFASDLIPPHSRWRHFDTGRERIGPLLNSWASADKTEVTKRLIDLFLVSVLLDAGAGNRWVYTERHTGNKFSRSEGLAIASLDAFLEGYFSGEKSQPFRVDANGLSLISVDETSNPMSGLEGRTSLLSNLSQALRTSPEFFGVDARPGNLIDFLTKESQPDGVNRKVHISALFHALIQGLAPIWPVRNQLAGISLGDVWSCNALVSEASTGIPAGAKFNPSSRDPVADDLVPFHKLTQWLTYSLVEPLEKVLGWKVEGMEDMTGLPEYRNGGLLVDFGVLTLRQETISSFYPDPNSDIPLLPPSHSAIIEWRAMTVIELDRIASAIRTKLGEPSLTLPQVLESATWKGGREIARIKRPTTGGPPIDIESDGTVF